MPEIRMIPVDLIDPHPHNPRRDLGDLTELADSINAHGIRQNLLENIQRADLSPVEEAECYQQLLDLGVKVRAIAKATGRAEKTVTGRLRLLKLPDKVREQWLAWARWPR